MTAKKATRGPKAPKLMKISEAAQAAGVSKQTIEYYILVGLIAPLRSATGRRGFDAALVHRIRLIRQLNRTGYTLRDIRETYLRPRRATRQGAPLETTAF